MSRRGAGVLPRRRWSSTNRRVTGRAGRRLVGALVLGLAALLAGCVSDAPDDTIGLVTARPEPEPAPAPGPEPESDPEPASDAEPDRTRTRRRPAPQDPRDRSPLTGLPLDDDVLARPLVTVKIDNTPQARPQTGIERADLVVEGLVEAGVTRFFAVFHGDLPEVAGPIRSARPVDTQLLQGLGRGAFVYSGARDEVLALLAGTPSIRVTEGAPGMFRDGGRRAPHNLYVRPATALAHALERGAEPLGEVGFVFDARPPPGPDRCPAGVPDCDAQEPEVTVRMSRDTTVGWRYDPQTRRYSRLESGVRTTVTGPDRIAAANVVLLATRQYVGASGFPETDVVTADARAVVLRDGRRYELRWRKPSPAAPLELVTPAGEPFPLAPGPSWVLLATDAALPDPPG
jgi:hypothetical protein